MTEPVRRAATNRRWRTAAEAGELLKHAAHPVRAAALACLADARGSWVSWSRLVRCLNVPPPALSGHLKQLIDAGFLEKQRDGTVQYRLSPLGEVLGRAVQETCRARQVVKTSRPNPTRKRACPPSSSCPSSP